MCSHCQGVLSLFSDFRFQIEDDDVRRRYLLPYRALPGCWEGVRNLDREC